MKSDQVAIEMEIYIPGSDGHIVDIEALFRLLGKALHGKEIEGGLHSLKQNHDGRIWLNNRLVYAPKNLAQPQDDMFDVKPIASPEPIRANDFNALLQEGRMLGAVIVAIDKPSG